MSLRNVSITDFDSEVIAAIARLPIIEQKVLLRHLCEKKKLSERTELIADALKSQQKGVKRKIFRLLTGLEASNILFDGDDLDSIDDHVEALAKQIQLTKGIQVKQIAKYDLPSDEEALNVFFRELGFSPELVSRMKHGFPDNGSFLRESLAVTSKLIDCLTASENEIVNLLIEKHNFSLQQVERSIKTLTAFRTMTQEE